MAKKAVTLPINTPPLQNVDGMVLDQLSETLYDGFIDELGNTNKRAGLTPHTDLGSFKRSEGAYWFENQAMACFIVMAAFIRSQTILGLWSILQILVIKSQVMAELCLLTMGLPLLLVMGLKLYIVMELLIRHL